MVKMSDNNNLIAMVLTEFAKHMDGSDGCGYRSAKAVLEMIENYQRKESDNG